MINYNHSGRKVQSSIDHMYDVSASKYEGQDGHSFNLEEKEIWRNQILNVVKGKELDHILDAGAGTGLLTSFVNKLNISKKITGVDCSLRMLDLAQQKNNHSSINYIQGDTHDLSLFSEREFDCIMSRQVVCHFYDPLTVFVNWNKWLKSNGIVIVVDGLWTRESWGNIDLVDKLPLSCIKSTNIIGQYLIKSGFQIVKEGYFDDVINRYFIIAKKNIDLN